MEKSEVGKSGDGFIDRSKVRILLCDNDEKSSEEVFTLLCKCSYQVTSVKSPRQVIDALNAEGPDIDIILSEVDLPMSKGLKMLKYITRDKELRRIPVIMMSGQDDVPIVVKCLKFGAADYLVKPLRTNELLNLWTHMWRRRRLLGLVEKNIVSFDFDMVVSDHSDGNTNSATLFSDDTDEKSRKSTNLETCASVHLDDDMNTAAAAPMAVESARQCQPDINDRRAGHMSSVPKKSQLKIGESSAFFTYVKSITSKNEEHGCAVVARAITDFSKQIPEIGSHSPDNQPSSNSVPESFSMERSCTPPFSRDVSQQGNSKERRTASPNDVAGSMHHPAAYPYYIPGVMNQVPMQSTSIHANPAVLPHYAHIPQHHMPGMAAYAYYPFGVCVQPGQLPMHHQYPVPPFENRPSESNEGRGKTVDRREAALMKFRQKRKERCFDKKIRYVNRKKLAERRPHLRGQFVRKGDGGLVDQPVLVEDEEDESDDEDQADSSHDDDASMCAL